MNLFSIRHSWPESAGFSMDRPNGATEYIFLHFQTEIYLRQEDRINRFAPVAVIIYSHGVPQYITAKEPLLHDWIHITGDVTAELGRVDLEPNRIYYPQDGSFITPIVRELELEFFSPREHYNDFCDLKLRELFVKLSRSVQEKKPLPHLAPEIVATLQELRFSILSAPEKHWRIEDMAKMVHLSESYLYAIYRQQFGVSPNKDVILGRVEKAKKLLGNHSVNETASLVGYNNPYHFIHQFRQIVGVSPGKYCEVKSPARE